MAEQLDSNMLIRYFRGTAPPTAVDAIAQWVAGDPARTRYLEVAREAWLATGAIPARFDVDRAWQVVGERIVTQEPARQRVFQLYPSTTPRSRRVRRYVSTVAAAVLVVATGSAIMWPRITAMRHGALTTGLPASREYATGKGQRTEILLVDGTRVVLSVASRLRVPTTYGAHSRDVDLDGEAFFEVRHDARKPFRVHAARAITEDLGTAFAVRSYPGDAGAVVLVTSGRVAVRADSAAVRQVMLTGGQRARLDDAGNIAVDRATDLNRDLAWMHGELAFHMNTLGDVVRVLERWYDVDITLGDSSLANAQLTATFTNKPLDDVLDVVANTLDLRYTRSGSHVRFAATRSSK
jgi:transmembrane sensor